MSWLGDFASNTPTGPYATWDGQLYFQGPYSSYSLSNFTLDFQIEGRPVPEPATLALLGVGAFMAIRNRKRSVARPA